MPDKFNPPRRTFLSNSSKVVAGASLAAVWPGKLQATQWLLAEAAATGPSHAVMEIVSMLAARPAELGAKVFADVPLPLRSSMLQIQSVLVGNKPGCRLSLWVQELQGAIEYLKGLNCAIVIAQVPPSQSYAQTSLPRRQLLKAMPRLRVYVAKSLRDAKRLEKLENERADYRALGLALGYPSCCVDAAVNHDQNSVNEKGRVARQANLNAIAVSVSSAADFRCNQFLVESELHNAAPLSAIAHYPCKLDCPETVALGKAALELSARKWPIWTVTLCELLRAPIVYWSDESWPADYWDEYCGLALIEARNIGGGEWNSPLPAIRLGAEQTPAGPLPQSVVSVKIGKKQVLLRNATGEASSYTVQELGPTWVLNWRDGKVEKVT
ncbi:MAG: hypothetical protein QOF62_2906 [Pyrinomonadaceae bacterium]|jgi:hypothetical protein|nr:hypothetical protein [Pyrinomonadaceae bacterium]